MPTCPSMFGGLWPDRDHSAQLIDRRAREGRRRFRPRASDVFVWHGYASLYLEGRWVKATPTFNIALCERFGVKPLEFDGTEDALLHPFDQEGRRHMEYVRDHGTFPDVPVPRLIAAMRAAYPRLFAARKGGDFAAEAADEARR